MKESNPVIYEWKVQFDCGDPWGSAMSGLFPIADYLTDCGECVPDFQQSIFGSDTDDYFYQALVEIDASVDDCWHAFKVLSRYRDFCERAGLSY